MSTAFMGEGNIGSDAEVKMFPPNGNRPPRGLLRLNVRFDNPVPTDNGTVDKGGFWANVEVWNRDVEQWARLYQKGMRVMVSGRMVLDEWEDSAGNKKEQFKVLANRIGILPFRISQVVLDSHQGNQPNPNQGNQPNPNQGNQPNPSANDHRGAYSKSDGPDGEWNNPMQYEG